MFFFMFPWSTAPDIPRNPQESAPSSASIWRHWAQGQAQKWVHWLTGSNLGTPTMREWCFFGEYAIVPFFPECVARVPVSLWGSGGWGCVRSTLRSRAQPSATVRSRPQPFAWGPYGRAYGKFCRGDPFWRFQTSGCFVSRGRRGTSWHSRRVLQRVEKSFCVAGAILLRRFQKMCCSFRGRRSTLDASIVIFRGRRSTLDASCGVFFVNLIGRAASSGDKVQIPWQAWHFVRCAENWRKPRTKHRFWGCKFSGSKENS